MYDPDQFSTWCMSDELGYLESLNHHNPKRRREILEGYAAALKYRPRSQKYLDFTKLHERIYELLNGDPQ